jgi:hypothetical protein
MKRFLEKKDSPEDTKLIKMSFSKLEFSMISKRGGMPDVEI